MDDAPIPTTTPTNRCRRCCGDGRELTRIYAGTRDGQRLYRLAPSDCTRCKGRGYVAHRPSPTQPDQACGASPVLGAAWPPPPGAAEGGHLSPERWPPSI